MAELFGFTITRGTKELPASFAPPISDDGAQVVTEGGMYGTYVDLEGSTRTESELVTRYRRMSMSPECDNAIDDIVHEFIVYDEEDRLVDINLDLVEGLSVRNKKILKEEFDTILELLEFNEKAYEIARVWYIDGRLHYHVVIDPKDPKRGILELRFIDPRKIKKVRNTKKERIPGTQVQVTRDHQDFYLFNDKGFVGYPGGSPTAAGQNQGVKIASDAIVQCTSGVMSEDNRMVLSHLHKAIKPLNQLRILEDATVIYRIARAPERRIFKIDVGNLPKVKAEQYLRDVMARYRNKLVYDASTGEIRDDRNYMSMLEDFWLPSREGGRGTDISTLPGGQNLGEVADIEYFQRKLYRSLNVPISRLESSQGFNLGRSTEITRDELKFTKFVQRLRKKFTELFNDLLRTQLVLKSIINDDDWVAIKEKIKYDFLADGHFSELKNAELLRERIALANDVRDYVGKYFSVNYVRKNILKQSEREISDIDNEIKKEIDDGIIASPQTSVSGNEPDEII